MAIQLSPRRPGGWPDLAWRPGCLGTRRLIAGTPHPPEHHVRSATPGVSGRRRHCLAGSAGRSPAGRRWRSEFHEQTQRSRARICRPSNSRWRNRTARSSATVTARRQPSHNCRSPRGSPASRCGLSPARCANCTGIRTPTSGSTSSRARWNCAHPDRVQCRHLRDHRPVAMNRGKSQGCARHEFRSACGRVWKIPGSRRIHRRQGCGPIGEGRQVGIKTPTDLAA